MVAEYAGAYGGMRRLAPSLSRVSASVLIVEDEALVRAMGVCLFAEAGFRTIEAANGDEARSNGSRRMPGTRPLAPHRHHHRFRNGYAPARASGRLPVPPKALRSGQRGQPCTRIDVCIRSAAGAIFAKVA